MGIYHDASMAIKHYEHENGDVYLTTNGCFYAVTVIKQTSFSTEEHRARGSLDYLSAGEYFDVACRYLRNEIQWCEPIREFSCTYNPNKSCGCTDKNCPRALGGVAYRELFSKSCPYRKTRSR